METEITKSKISIKLRASLSDDMVVPYDLMIEAADAIDELNQRLIDQTAAGMERGKKDQEEIKRLNRELAQLQAEKSRCQDARKEGREEALNALVRTDPEQFSNEYFYSSIDSHGEFNGEKWNHKELLKLLDLDGGESLYDRLEQETCEQLYRIQDLENELEELRNVIPVSLNRAFSSGYQSGHEATVDGAFWVLSPSDYANHFSETITEMMEDGSLPEIAEFRAKYPKKEGA